jgi:antitoxin component YwqK of YwqJK toxin-antitoxin module
MSSRAYRTSIPSGAVEVVEEYYPTGERKSSSYFLGGEKVGFRQWDEAGRLEFEYAMRGGVKHGHEYRFYPNGRLEDKETYREGRLHGVGRQWSEDGRLLVTWKLVDGTGLDLWCDTQTGTLAEEQGGVRLAGPLL